jgi:hypothetical protein
MGNRFRVGLVALLAVGALVAGPLAGDAAWAKKSKIKCKINGETFKTKGPAGGASGGYDVVSATLVVGGGRAKVHGRNPATVEADVRVLDWTIFSTPDLTSATFPVVVPVSGTLFSIVRTRGLDPEPIENKLWEGEGVTMTITSFKDDRIKGTAEGTIPAVLGVDTPAVVEDCKFSVLLNGVPVQ